MKKCHELEKNLFFTYFFNMDFSLIMALICMKSCIHSAEIFFEGSVSQNFDTGLSFCFMVEKKNFENKKCKKSQKLPVFCHKTKTRA